MNNKQGIELISGKDFTKEEIMSISKYIITNVPYTILEQIFPLTEDVIKKSEIFTIMYRMIGSAKNYISNPETHQKLVELLESCEKQYFDIYEHLLNYKSVSTFGKSPIFNSLVHLMSLSENIIKINNLIDCFLVFAEKQQLQDIEKFVAIDTDKKYGVDLVEELSKEVKD